MSNCKIVPFYSFRNGPGKSTVMTNLAVALANKGKRLGLLDADFYSPGLQEFFPDLGINYTFNDYLWNRFSMQKIFPYKASFSNNLYLIPASAKLGDIAKSVEEGFPNEQIILEGLYDLIAQLKLDYLFIDVGSGLSKENRLYLSLADMLVMVIRPNQQDFKETIFSLEIAQKIGLIKKFLILNQFNEINSQDQDDVTIEIHRYFQKQISLLGILPYNNQIRTSVLPEILRKFSPSSENESGNTSGIFYLDYPQEYWSRELDKIAQNFLKQK